MLLTIKSTQLLLQIKFMPVVEAKKELEQQKEEAEKVLAEQEKHKRRSCFCSRCVA
jgi:hypothetical protein